MIDTKNEIVWGKGFCILIKKIEGKTFEETIKNCTARSKSGDLVISAGNPVILRPTTGWTHVELPSSVLSAVLRCGFEIHDTRGSLYCIFGEESSVRDYAKRKGIVIK